MTDATGTAELRPLQVETNGINVIAENERKGHPHDLFWPWFAANVSVLGISYGSFVLGFGISFWQAVIVGVVGIVLSFLACGVIAVAGKRGSAPTMVLSRAAFAVNGNTLPARLSTIVGAEPRLPATAMNPQARNDSTIPTTPTMAACQNEMPKPSTNEP